MSIAASNVAYFGSAPVPGGSGILALGGQSNIELAYTGQATMAAGDNSTTTWVVNYMDGSNALPFTPSAVSFVRTGGNAAATIVMYASATNNVVATVTFSAAPATNATVTGIVQIFK